TRTSRASRNCGRADLAFLFRSIGDERNFLVCDELQLGVSSGLDRGAAGGRHGRIWRRCWPGVSCFSQRTLWVSSTHTKNFAIAGFDEKLTSSRKLKLGLLKSHLEAHAAQELAPTASLFQEVPPQLCGWGTVRLLDQWNLDSVCAGHSTRGR